jgi:hypothetical protein
MPGLQFSINKELYFFDNFLFPRPSMAQRNPTVAEAWSSSINLLTPGLKK